MEIRHGIYGLPQSGILTNKLLKERLAVDSYFELPYNPGLFKHETRHVWFTLTVDDFGIKHIGNEHALHLTDTLKKHYKVKVVCEGSLYCGIFSKLHYNEGYLDISMPNYVAKKLARYKQLQPKKP